MTEVEQLRMAVKIATDQRNVAMNQVIDLSVALNESRAKLAEVEAKLPPPDKPASE
jgi:hypothetical protein